MAFLKRLIVTCIVLVTPTASHAAPLIELPKPFPLSDKEISSILLKEGQTIPSSDLLHKLRLILFSVRCHENFDKESRNSGQASVEAYRKLSLLREEASELSNSQKKEIYRSYNYKKALKEYNEARVTDRHISDISSKWRNVYLTEIEELKESSSDILADEVLGRIHDSITGEWNKSLSAIECSIFDAGIVENVTPYFAELRQRNDILIRYGSNLAGEMENDAAWLSAVNLKMALSDDLGSEDCVAVILNGTEMFRYTQKKVERGYHLRVAEKLAEEVPILSRRYKSDCY